MGNAKNVLNSGLLRLFFPDYTSLVVYTIVVRSHVKRYRNNDLTWRTFAFVGKFRRLLASAPVLARRWRTGNVVGLAIFASVSGFTHASAKSKEKRERENRCD